MELGRRRSASGRWLWQTTSSTLLRILSCFHITLIFPLPRPFRISDNFRWRSRQPQYERTEWLCEVGGLFEFAAISTARDYSMEELDTWTYYIPQERDQVGWYCSYAIILKPVELEFGIYERVGLAKIFRSAFSTGPYQRTGWKQIILQ